jgi:3-dehydroquinate synthase
LGTFQEPLATFVDTGFLQTLPDTEWRNGFAELLKHALIADKTLWEALTQIKNIPLELTADQIRRGVEIKREMVSQDPIESGLRKTLNFGHTIGHALESYYLHSDIPLAHGHAVAIGMLLEAQLSVYQANLSQTEFAAIEKCIKQTYPIQIPNDAEALWTLMQQDKKNANGEVRCCLLNAIGTCVFDQTLTFQAFEHVMAQFNS